MSSDRPSIAARLLSSLARGIVAHPAWFVWPQLLLAGIAVWYTATHLGFDLDRNSLVGADKEYHRHFLDFKHEFPGQDDLVAVIESEHPEKNRQFVERLGARLEAESTSASPTNPFTAVFFKGDLPMMGRKALLFVPESDLGELHRTLRDYRPFIDQFTQVTNLASLARQISARIRSADRGSNAANASLIRALPALERIIVRARDSLGRPGIPPSPGVEALFGAGPEAERAKYITFAGGRLYLVNAKARLATTNEVPPRTASFWQRLTGGERDRTPAEIEEARTLLQGELNQAAVIRFRELVAATAREVPGVNVGLTGESVLEVDEMDQSTRDSTKATILSLVLCAVIFVVGYNETGRPLKAMACLLLGLIYTLGYTALAVGHLNILTITFVPMLIGLAIDFGVHLITRFEEELRHGRSDTEAIHKAIVNTGQGIFTGCFTTAGAFFAMAFTDFRGIEEMGIITGGGMLICLVPMMTLLPVMLLRRGRQLHLDHVAGRMMAAAERRAAAHAVSDGVDHRARLERLWLDRPWTVLGVTAALSGLCLAWLPRVSFDYNLLNMQSRGLPSVVFEKKLVDATRNRTNAPQGERTKSVLFGAVIADSLEEAAALEAKLKALPTVADVDSMAQFLNQDSRRKLEWIRQIKAEAASIRLAPPDETQQVNLTELSQRLWGLAGLLGLAADEIHRTEPDQKELLENLSRLRAAIVGLRVAMFQGSPDANARKLAQFQAALFDDIRDTFEILRQQEDSGGLRAEDLPSALRSRFIGIHGRHLIQVYPREDVWERTNQAPFVHELQAAAPAATGTPVQLYYYTELLKASYVEAAWWALGAVVVLVFIHFRSIVPVLFSLLPVALGMLWMVGFMGCFHIPFNPANIMTLPLVVGIGVTNGIHILNRFAEERNPGILAKSTGKAVLVSGLTTIAGFGSLVTADHQGIASLGWVMAVGTATCMIAGLTTLPALLTLRERRRGTAATGA
jgi:uncharacterized protein